MSNVDKLKYNGVEYDLGKSIDASLTQSGQPADAKEVGDKLNFKVDKIDGKGLSSNDYTTDEKTKLAGIENGANKTLIDTTLVNTGQAADAKSVGDAIKSVGDAIASQNTNINTINTNINAIKERTDNVEDDIATLQTNKVDKTTPLLNFDDTATDPLTDDGALANALRDLGILGTVALNGVLYVKKTLTELGKVIAGLKTTVASHTTRLRNFEVTVNDYFGNNTSGQTHTYTLESGACYLMCFGRTNGGSGSGLYFIQSHATMSQILAIAASSYITPTITGITLKVKVDTNYGQLYILKVGEIDT